MCIILIQLSLRRNSPVYLLGLLVMAGTLACSLSGLGQRVRSVDQTARAVRTKVSGVVTIGASVVDTAQAYETQTKGFVETVKAVATRGVPLLSTIEAVATHNPRFVETARAFFKDEVPTGKPPSDIPLLDQDQMGDYFGSSQYIFYITPLKYAQVLAFYQIEMANNDWQYLESESSEYALAALLNFSKDSRIAAVNLSYNTLNNTTVVIINITEQ